MREKIAHSESTAPRSGGLCRQSVTRGSGAIGPAVDGGRVEGRAPARLAAATGVSSGDQHNPSLASTTARNTGAPASFAVLGRRRSRPHAGARPEPRKSRARDGGRFPATPLRPAARGARRSSGPTARPRSRGKSPRAWKGSKHHRAGRGTGGRTPPVWAMNRRRCWNGLPSSRPIEDTDCPSRHRRHSSSCSTSESP